jgi:hypothetical protein
MIRPGTIVWFCIVVAVGYAMFQVKYEVMQQEQTLASINKQITEDREQIRVLDAEWTYLTRPARLQQLSDRFLHLQGMNSAQIVSLAAVPMRENAITPPGTSEPAPTLPTPIATATPKSVGAAPVKTAAITPAKPIAAGPAKSMAATAPTAPVAVTTSTVPAQQPATRKPSTFESAEELAAQFMSPRIASVSKAAR